MKIPHTAKIAIAFAIIYIVWGSTYLAIRVGLQTMPPLLMSGSRFLVAGGLLWLYTKLRGEAKPDREQLKNAALVGIGMVVAGNGLLTWAEQKVPSGPAALIVAIGPVMTALLMWARGAKRPTVETAFGLVLGLVGVGLLVFGGESAKIDPLGAAVIVLSTFGWSWGALHSQSSRMPQSTLVSNTYQMLFGGAAVFVAGLLLGEARQVNFSHVSSSSWFALTYLILLGSIGAYSAYIWLLQHVSATAAGSAAYVNPAVAVVLGAFFGEGLHPKALVAMMFIFAAVWMLKLADRPPKEIVCSPTPEPC